MADTQTIIAIAASVVAVVAAAITVMGQGGIVGIWRSWRQEGRDDLQELWASFEKRIELADARGSTEDANSVRREYEAQLEAWQAQQSLEKIAPRDISPINEDSSLSSVELEQLKQLLTDSKALSPAILSADDYFLRGNANYEAGEYEEALGAYDQSLVLRPEDPTTLMNRGATLNRLHRYEEALQPLNQSLALQPGDPATLYNLACVFSLREKPDDAFEGLRRAIEGSARFRRIAREDSDFDNIRNDPEFRERFQELVGEEEEEE